MELFNLHNIINTLVFAGIGIAVLIVAFIIVDLLTPHYSLWKEIVEKQNQALAILLGAFTLGLALIIAAALHG
jgi:putative membrane protein